jgi:hypothetical protein
MADTQALGGHNGGQYGGGGYSGDPFGLVDVTGQAPGSSRPDEAPARPGHRHDPRIDPPTSADRRRLLRWAALLAFCPVCLGVVVWAAIGMNGSYPTVKPPVPSGWQAVPGIYASFSAPSSWSLQQSMSDSSGDIYYSGPGGGAGESVAEADHQPPHLGPLPAIVGSFLEVPYRVTSVTGARIKNATVAWHYNFSLKGGGTAVGVLAWVKPTQSEIWMIVSPVSATTERALSTLTLAT